MSTMRSVTLKKYTYEKWNRLGYYIRKGEIARDWDKEGKALFSADQVEEKQDYSEDEYWYEGDPMDYGHN